MSAPSAQLQRESEVSKGTEGGSEGGREERCDSAGP